MLVDRLTDHLGNSYCCSYTGLCLFSLALPGPRGAFAALSASYSASPQGKPRAGGLWREYKEASVWAQPGTGKQTHGHCVPQQAEAPHALRAPELASSTAHWREEQRRGVCPHFPAPSPPPISPARLVYITAGIIPALIRGPARFRHPRYFFTQGHSPIL